MSSLHTLTLSISTLFIFQHINANDENMQYSLGLGRMYGDACDRGHN